MNLEIEYEATFIDVRAGSGYIYIFQSLMLRNKIKHTVDDTDSITWQWFHMTIFPSNIRDSTTVTWNKIVKPKHNIS